MSHFFAHMARMKLINRWPLMRNTQTENVQEHSLQVAMIAHGLALISNEYYDGNYSPEKAATLALFHDASEVLTGDLPTPVKYFNKEIEREYKLIEKMAEHKLLHTLPDDLQQHYQPLLISDNIDPSYKKLVKAADIISAYFKCIEELNTGNHEFERAKQRLEQALKKTNMPEVQHFIDLYSHSFKLSLDEITLEDQPTKEDDNDNR